MCSSNAFARPQNSIQLKKDANALECAKFITVSFVIALHVLLLPPPPHCCPNSRFKHSHYLIKMNASMRKRISNSANTNPMQTINHNLRIDHCLLMYRHGLRKSHQGCFNVYVASFINVIRITSTNTNGKIYIYNCIWHFFRHFRIFVYNIRVDVYVAHVGIHSPYPQLKTRIY